MLLTLFTTHRPASDLGFLLRKPPYRVQRFEVAAGVAHVMCPDADDDRRTVPDVDPAEPVRTARGPAGEEFSLGQYVNDRPYAASSLLAVTLGKVLGKVLGTAMRGRPDARPVLAVTAIHLEAHVTVGAPTRPAVSRRVA